MLTVLFFYFSCLKNRYTCIPHFSQYFYIIVKYPFFVRLHVSTVLSHHQVYKLYISYCTFLHYKMSFAKIFQILNIYIYIYIYTHIYIYYLLFEGNVCDSVPVESCSTVIMQKTCSNLCIIYRPDDD
jgi:hypothetical protein